MKILVTGGRGFIGSHFVERALDEDWVIVDIDKETYASSKSLPWDNNQNYTFIKQDIKDVTHLPSCDYLVNFAAESHVDNSISSSTVFMDSNCYGVHNLLELVRGKKRYDRPLFFQISTDEVYGDREVGEFSESECLKPSNPYSATKAAAEMLILSYSRTYDIDYVITRSTNNYGERQYEEKLIPNTISSLQHDRKVPVHGDGSYVRDWMYVKDNVDAIFTIIKNNIKNEIFNIGARNYMTNLEVVDEVLSWHNKARTHISFVENRWGQDLRYAVNNDKLSKLGWRPKHESGIYKWF